MLFQTNFHINFFVCFFFLLFLLEWKFVSHDFHAIIIRKIKMRRKVCSWKIQFLSWEFSLFQREKWDITSFHLRNLNEVMIGWHSNILLDDIKNPRKNIWNFSKFCFSGKFIEFSFKWNFFRGTIQKYFVWIFKFLLFRFFTKFLSKILFIDFEIFLFVNESSWMIYSIGLLTGKIKLKSVVVNGIWIIAIENLIDLNQWGVTRLF